MWVTVTESVQEEILTKAVMYAIILLKWAKENASASNYEYHLDSEKKKTKPNAQGPSALMKSTWTFCFAISRGEGGNEGHDSELVLWSTTEGLWGLVTKQ